MKLAGVGQISLEQMNRLKARLGSISPGKMNGFPLSVQQLLETEMPMLIEAVEDLTAQAKRYEQYVEDLEALVKAWKHRAEGVTA